MNTKLVLRGASLFEDPSAKPIDIVVHNQTITAITSAGDFDGVGFRQVDAHGLSVLPGVIDSHVHPIHDETGATVGRAAAEGGVTTACLHLYPDYGESVADAVARMNAEASDGTADFAHYIRLTPETIAEGAPGLGDVGAIGVKMFMAHPDKRAQVSLSDLARGMKICAGYDLPVVVHAEFGELIDALPEALEMDLSRLTLEDLAKWRSSEIEAAAIDAAAVTARCTGALLYIPHVSGRLPLSRIMAHREAGARIVAETCPHYVFLSASDITELGGLARVLPPLRTHDDNQLLAGAIRDGSVDIVASDHCGHGSSAKRRDDVAGSKAGLPGIGQLAPLMINEAIRGTKITRRAVVRSLCTTPADVLRLQSKGVLAPGRDADFVLLDETKSHVIEASRSLDASEYSPYEGMALRGVIEQVWRRGECVVEDSRLQVTNGGRLQTRGR